MILLDATVNGKLATLLLDTGASNSTVDAGAAGFHRSEFAGFHSSDEASVCPTRTVALSLAQRSWANRRVCIRDLSDVSKSMKTRIDGLLGEDVLREFESVRIDYKAQTVTLEN